MNGSSLGGVPLIKKSGGNPKDVRQETSAKQIRPPCLFPPGVPFSPLLSLRNGLCTPSFPVPTRPSATMSFITRVL